MHVSVAFLRAFRSALVDVGLPASSVDLPDDPHASVPWAECMRRLSSTLAASHEPELGVLVGERLSLSALHLLGNLLLTTRNLREAAPLVSRYMPLLLGGARFDLEEVGDEARYAFTPPPCEPACEHFVAQLVLTIVVNTVADTIMLSSEQLVRAELRQKAPPSTAAFERVFGKRIVFGAQQNRLVIERSVLDSNRKLPDETLGEILRERADRLLELRGQRKDLVLRLREHLSSADLTTLNLASAARALGMGASTLRRRLDEHGTTFSDVADEVRKELALQLLRDELVSLKELSARLGFSEPRAFHRAFRRWTGTTPSQFRELKIAG